MYGLGLAKGLMVTAKNLILPSRMMTIQYPDRKVGLFGLSKATGTPLIELLLKDPINSFKALLGMAEVKENVVFLDDKEIKVADLTDEQKYYHSQVVDLRNQKARISFQLDQINASLKVFEDAFIKSTKAKAEEVLATDNG